jgi:DNA repair protein RecN (Recombination protein N)
VQRIQKELEAAKEILYAAADRLSKARKKAALRLEKQIIQNLEELNFLTVQFRIDFESLEEPGESGKDSVEFMISMNPGEPLRPLHKVASGGELSRIMLALKVVMADEDGTETLIFDEIDSGISGRTAQKISEKIACLAKKHQVICITHLAQIASMADVHFYIEKNTVNNSTETTVRKLMEEESVMELARIIGGAEITDTVIESAREMKKLAQSRK